MTGFATEVEILTLQLEVGDSKVCRKCGETKTLKDFHRHNQMKDGRHPWCATCRNAKTAGYYQRFTPEQRVMHRRRVFKWRYGISFEEIQALYEKQNGCCAICGVAADQPVSHTDRNQRDATAALCIDHNHTTKEIRGLLCRECNIGLGKFSDQSDLLLRAAAYLKGR